MTQTKRPTRRAKLAIYAAATSKTPQKRLQALALAQEHGLTMYQVGVIVAKGHEIHRRKKDVGDN